MLQRSGVALYSSCVGDKPRTCSATICVVISMCTRRCSRSSLLMGAANRGAVNKQTVSVRVVQPLRAYVRVLMVRVMVVGAIPKHITWTIRGEEGHHRRKIAMVAAHTIPGSPKSHTPSLVQAFELPAVCSTSMFPSLEGLDYASISE